MYTIQRIDQLDTRPLRHLVLWPHREKMEDCTIDIDHRVDAIHLGAFDEQRRLVGICSLFEMQTPKLAAPRQYRLRAMATHPDARGTGAGALIVHAAIETVHAMGYDVLWCDARKVALGFYAKLGFDRIDEWYDVPNIGPHQLMFYRLKM